MENTSEFDSFQHLIQESAEQLDAAVKDASIPDIEPLKYTDKHYHYIGKRGDMEGGYFIRTRSTFNIYDYKLSDVKDNKDIVSPVICSQVFGAEKDGREVPIVSVDIDFDSEPSEDFEAVSIHLNPEWAKIVNPSLFKFHDMEGYQELFSIIHDVHNYGLTQDEFEKDYVRISNILDEAGKLSRNNLGQEVEYYHLFARRTGFCAIESKYRGSYVDRRIQAVDFTDGSEAAAQILTWDSGSSLEDIPSVQPVIPPETSASEALRSLRYTKLAIELFSNGE